MTKKPHPLGFVIADGMVSGPLKIGMTISGIVHKGFQLREATVEDLLEAELEADVSKPLNFNAQLLIRQLVRVGDFEGPFTLGLIKRLKPIDWRILRAAQSEADALGEAGPGSDEAS